MNGLPKLMACALVIGAASLTSGCAHVVRLSRPEQVGDRFVVRSQGSLRGVELVRVKGAVVSDKTTRLEVSLDATAEVLAVDRQAQATRVSYRVASSSASDSAATHEVLPAGTTVVVESVDGKAAFTVAGAPVPGETRKELELVLSAHAADGARDEEVFGTAAPHRVGDSWPVNQQAAAAELARTLGGAATDLAVSGSTWLRAARADAGERCLEVEGEMRITGVPLPMPPGFTVTQADTQVRFWGLVPADPAAPRRHGERIGMTMTVRASGKTREGQPVELELEQQRDVTRRLSPPPR